VDDEYPFNETVAREIKTLATIVFAGGSPENDSELEGLWLKWQWWFNLFFWCTERKTASFLHFPCEGSILKQGYCTMNILNLMQTIYIKELYKTRG